METKTTQIAYREDTKVVKTIDELVDALGLKNRSSFLRMSTRRFLASITLDDPKPLPGAEKPSQNTSSSEGA